MFYDNWQLTNIISHVVNFSQNFNARQVKAYKDWWRDGKIAKKRTSCMNSCDDSCFCCSFRRFALSFLTRKRERDTFRQFNYDSIIHLQLSHAKLHTERKI